MNNLKDVRVLMGPLDQGGNRPVLCLSCGAVIGNMADASDYDPVTWDGKPASSLLPLTPREQSLGAWLAAHHTCQDPVYRGAGQYGIRWERDGKRRTVLRWANDAAELGRIIGAFQAKGCVVLCVRWRGA